MVILAATIRAKRIRRQCGALMTDIIVALGVLAVGIFPLAYSFGTERRALRAEYYHAVAMEVVDGEMEVLKAGEWKSYEPGTQPYRVKVFAVKNLPQGRFLLTREGHHLRLEWDPEKTGHGGSIMRECDVLEMP